MEWQEGFFVPIEVNDAQYGTTFDPISERVRGYRDDANFIARMKHLYEVGRASHNMGKDGQRTRKK